MVKVYNDISSMEELVGLYNKIVLYGAGSSCKLLIKSFWELISDSVLCVVDTNEKIDGTFIEYNNGCIEVFSLERFISTYKSDLERIVLLLTPVASSKIIPKLDMISELDGMKTYLYPMIANKCKVDYFSFSSEKTQLIQKKIHYIWIGGKDIPAEYKKNIESWKKYCPDYEIVCWNEKNYDFNKNVYMKEAYELGGEYLMYATDYARKDILYNYGGIYFDTDVELIKPIDKLLYNHAFIGIEDNGQVNSGSALGSEMGHPMMKALMECYENEHFLDDNGKPRIIYNTFYETKCLIEHGYKMENKYKCIEGLVCFPREVFMPICFAGMDDFFTDNTVSIHKINPGDYKANKRGYKMWRDRVIE